MKKGILISGVSLSMLFAGISIFGTSQSNNIELNNAKATGGCSGTCYTRKDASCCTCCPTQNNSIFNKAWASNS